MGPLGHPFLLPDFFFWTKKHRPLSQEAAFPIAPGATAHTPDFKSTPQKFEDFFFEGNF